MTMTQNMYKFIFNEKVRNAKETAQDRFFNKLEPHRGEIIVTRNMRPYPFGMNQAEWELMVFSSGWNRALEYMLRRDLQDNIVSLGRIRARALSIMSDLGDESQAWHDAKRIDSLCSAILDTQPEREDKNETL